MDDSLLDYQLMQKEAEKFSSLQMCPLCGESLIHSEGFFIQNDQTLLDEQFFTNPICRNSVKPVGARALWLNGLDQICSHMKEVRAKIDDQTANEKVSVYVASVDIPVTIPAGSVDISQIRSTSESLKNYLQHLVNIESSILSVLRRLSTLYRKQIDLERLVNGTKSAITYSIRADVELAEEKVHLAKKSAQEIKSAPLPFINIAKPIPPKAPTLQEPNFFNKKRVNAENQQLQTQYTRAMAQYNAQLQEFQEKEQKIKIENELKKQNDIEKANEAIVTAQREYELLQADMQAKIDAAAIMDSPERNALNNLNCEINTAETLLKNLFEMRNRLYAYDIIYSKYRNFIAVSTFCEYLLTGRCSSLEGPDGAYNLYESECRSKTIISQLSQIAGSIDQLKETQYMLWEHLQTTNKEIEYLNSLMTVALPTLTEQVQNIANSNNITAYNSAVTAYYSRINAEIASSDRYISMICW